MTTVHLDAAAALTTHGLQANSSLLAWEADQAGPADVRRPQVLSEPYPTFGKLTQADRVAFSAACLLFSRYPGCTGERVGISMGVPYGSLSTDLRYQETSRSTPSPALFSATLPSSPVSEIAIHFKLRGPNRVFAHHCTPGLCAVYAAFQLLRLGKADSVLAVFLGALEATDWHTPFATEPTDGMPYAYALLFTASPKPAGLGFRSSLNMDIAARRPGGQGVEAGLFDGIMAAVRQGTSATFDFRISNCTGTFDMTKDA